MNELEDKYIRFEGTTQRCPDTPFFIKDNDKKDFICIFRHEELACGYETLNKICDLLNQLNYEILVLKEDKDNDKLDTPNMDLLMYIWEEYTKKLKKLRSEKSFVQHEYINLQNDYEHLKDENIRLKYYLESLLKDMRTPE